MAAAASYALLQLMWEDKAQGSKAGAWCSAPLGDRSAR
jgi:hypothetical protein